MPGLSRSLPARRTIFGEPLERTGGLLGAALDPTSPQRDVRRDDPLVAELARVGAAIGPLTRLRDESAEEFNERQILTGQRLRERLELLVQWSGYREADPERQRELIEDKVTEVRRRTSREMRRRREYQER